MPPLRRRAAGQQSKRILCSAPGEGTIRGWTTWKSVERTRSATLRSSARMCLSSARGKHRRVPDGPQWQEAARHGRAGAGTDDRRPSGRGWVPGSREGVREHHAQIRENPSQDTSGHVCSHGTSCGHWFCVRWLLRILHSRRPGRQAAAVTAGDQTEWRGKLGPGKLMTQYGVFVSSGDDAVDLRNRVDGLIRNAVNPELATHQIQFAADLWEQKAPRRLFGRETVDDEFVKRAVRSDLVMTLLLARLGNGTRKEIEAVLRSPTELKLLWFVNRDERPATEVASYLSTLARKQKVRYRRAGRPDTRESNEAMVQVLLAAALESLARKSRDIRERR